MSEPVFSHPIEIQIDDLRFEPFLETNRVRDFDCGEKDLNDFLNTEEVSKYEQESLGSTHLVFYQGNVVAYFTVSLDGLRVEYLKTYKSFTRFSELKLESLPAVKIGRLAVAKEWQNKGLGRLLVKNIIGLALNLGKLRTARLIIVQAKPKAIGFYRKCGFQMTFETKREKKRKNRTMFLDLHSVEDI